MARRRAREINVFNFSFLDVLACTLGAVTFILFVVLLATINRVDVDLIGMAEENAKRYGRERERANQLEMELGEYKGLKELVDEQGKELEDLRGKYGRAAAEKLQLGTELEYLKETVAKLQGETNVPQALKDENEKLKAALAQAKAKSDASQFPPLRVATMAVPNPSVDSPYRLTLAATGGLAPYRWAVVGDLPEGLKFNNATGEVSGIPQKEESTTVVAQVSDSQETPAIAKRELTFTVKPAYVEAGEISEEVPWWRKSWIVLLIAIIGILFFVYKRLERYNQIKQLEKLGDREIVFNAREAARNLKRKIF